ncbi:MAG TPA: ATP-binding protein, partial [Limnobacter sp.]|uniref:hybrid sensor histidine kinase/response regulator n=1 Tax=Limnobacter sp. TaxID=2003368 RepID=UPI002E2FE7B1
MKLLIRKRLETQVNAAFFVCLFIFLPSVVWLLNLNEERQQVNDNYVLSEQAAQAGSRLLQLTYSISTDKSPTSMQQWKGVELQLAQDVASMARALPRNANLAFINEKLAVLDELYSALGQRDDKLAVNLKDQRTTLLVERMLAEAHEITEVSHQISTQLRLAQAVQTDRLVFAFGTAMGALMLAMVLVQYFVQKRIIKPLKQIENTARKFRAGNLSARVGLPDRGDEMGALSMLLDDLATRLELRIQSLSTLNEKFSREVHQRQASEERLARALEASQLTSNLLESAGRVSGVGAWFLDLRTLELNWSSQTYRIAEAPESHKPTVEDTLTHYPGEASAQLAAALEEAQATGKAIDLELPFVTFKGKPLWVNVFGEAEFEVVDGERKAIKLFGAFQDISERKRNEISYLKAREAAEAANRTKGEFLANMSHEIRTPLNAIVGIAYILRQSKLDADQLDLLQKLEMSGRNLIELVGDILDLSKIEAGKIELEEHEFTVHEVFDSLAGIATGYLLKPGVDVIFAPECTLPAALLGDGTKLKQVLVNLLGNSLKFTASGYVKVRAHLLEMTDHECQLQFIVEDSGIGMDQATIAKLFSNFTQGDSSISRRFGGSGIGLALSGRLIERMGGKIEVESTPGVGSRFIFSLRFKTLNQAFVPVPDLEPVNLVLVDSQPKLYDPFRHLASRFKMHDVFCAPNVQALFDLLPNVVDSLQQRCTVVVVDPRRVALPDRLQIEARLLEAGASSCQFVGLERLQSAQNLNGAADSLLPITMKLPVTPSVFCNSLLRALHIDRESRQLSEPAHALPADALAGLTVLAVDDNQLNLKILRKILINHGAAVILAHNGEEALREIENHRAEIDVCLMDVQMPVMDGLEACRQIRSRTDMADLPVLALTAGAMLAEHQDALAAGMN